MSIEMSVAEAKARFSECVRDAEGGEQVIITRHGKPVALVVGGENVQLVQRVLAAGGVRGLAAVAGGWEGSDELADVIAAAPRMGRGRSSTDS